VDAVHPLAETVALKTAPWRAIVCFGVQKLDADSQAGCLFYPFGEGF
jgi:hypothetical protein